MEINISQRNNFDKIFENEIEKFKNFHFTKSEYIGCGEIKKQSSGACKFAKIKIRIEKSNNFSSSKFYWRVTNEQIPIEYLDVILSTIKIFFNTEDNFIDYKNLNFHIIGGEFHNVDSNNLSFEIATVKALISAISDD